MKTELLINQIPSDLTDAPRARWMVIEDNEGVLELLGDLLENFRAAEVCRFHSASEALEAFAASPDDFQLVITDLEMPGMDGIELCRRLHTASPRLKILLTTGSRAMTEIEAMRCGFCGLLPKPFPAGALREAMETAGAFNGCTCHRNN